MAWRSQEQHHNLNKDIPKTKGKPEKMSRYGEDEIGPQGMPAHFFDENGEINLSKVKGEEARRYFETRLHIPMPPGVSRMKNQPFQ
jgi:hypothetical protein